MEVRPPLLQQISNALTPAIQPAAGVGRGEGAGTVGPVSPAPPPVEPPQLANLGEAIKTGNTSLLISPQEKEILDALFVNPSQDSGANGLRLYSAQDPRPALKGSFVDLRG